MASSAGGYTFAPTAPALTAEVTGAFTFQITGPDGSPVTTFDVEHDKRMHLIVVRRDGTAFQHVHPTTAPDGTWSVPLSVPTAGSYRAFAVAFSSVFVVANSLRLRRFAAQDDVAPQTTAQPLLRSHHDPPRHPAEILVPTRAFLVDLPRAR